MRKILTGWGSGGGCRAALSALLVCAGAARVWAAPDVLMSALDAELKRNVQGLSRAEKVPLYHLGYEVWDGRDYYASATVGAMTGEYDYRYRVLGVDARVGSPKLDNTHQVKGPEAWRYGQNANRIDLPTDDDAAALRAGLWLNTDRAYKDALNRYTKVETNKSVTATEEDGSDDFSSEEPVVHADTAALSAVDAGPWRERLRRLSRALKPYAFIHQSGVLLSVETENRYIANSEGTRIAAGSRYVTLSYSMTSQTTDGMSLARSKSYNSDSLADLPPDDVVLRDMKVSVAELDALRKAPLISPYSGPAIIRNRATAVYFHEILGHRLEGHRQKIEGEGQTFTKMVGQRVVSPLISVYDDPTLSRFRGTFLRGAYAFDDEGVPSRRLPLVEHGILKNFMTSRMPIKGFERSNGHGRREKGRQVVPRMGNTIIEASETVSYEKLRERLIDEIRRQGKPYGLIFDDIAGGFTMTTRERPQSFKVLPLLVYRVYADGRPDEPVRGVDIVGTPLAAFAKIAAAADDDAVFNGSCGAESGQVPVSGVAPSVLVTEIEVERKAKSSEQPPVLPVPFHDEEAAR